MSNPIFDAIGVSLPENDIINQFNNFRQQMKGINPTEEIDKLLRSGVINQQQLNQAQQMAHQMKSIFKNVH